MDFWEMVLLTQVTAVVEISAASSSDYLVTICRVLKLLCSGGAGTAVTKQAQATWGMAAQAVISIVTLWDLMVWRWSLVGRAEFLAALYGTDFLTVTLIC